MVQLVSKEEIEKEKKPIEYRSIEQPAFKRYDNEKKGFKNETGERSGAGLRAPSRAERGSAKGGGGGNGKGFKPKAAPKSAVDGFVGREVKLRMRDGTYENGRLESIFQYEYVIIGDDGMPVIILKHAVDSIRLKV